MRISKETERWLIALAAVATILLAVRLFFSDIKTWIEGLSDNGRAVFYYVGLTYLAGMAGFFLHRLLPARPPKIEVSLDQPGLEAFHGKFIKSRDSRTGYYVKHGIRYPMPNNWEHAKAIGLECDYYKVPKELTNALKPGPIIDSPDMMKRLVSDV